ncbi:hypothetical protein B4U80_11665 [Leptotrombidium deliense]|uniref:Caspase family p20 domain-containing protein n=1 Tax=Leptotrombidium deliense TaxID=299467 RepID=A0A443S3X8_9ACAR|nr:hypothetical protein B4U80_11665 [Leptotrombidium deliense]
MIVVISIAENAETTVEEEKIRQLLEEIYSYFINYEIRTIRYQSPNDFTAKIHEALIKGDSFAEFILLAISSNNFLFNNSELFIDFFSDQNCEILQGIPKYFHFHNIDEHITIPYLDKNYFIDYIDANALTAGTIETHIENLRFTNETHYDVSNDLLRDTVVAYATLKHHRSTRTEYGTALVSTLLRLCEREITQEKDIFQILRDVENQFREKHIPNISEFQAFGFDDPLFFVPFRHVASRDRIYNREKTLLISVNYSFFARDDNRTGSAYDDIHTSTLAKSKNTIYIPLKEIPANELKDQIAKIITQEGEKCGILVLCIMSHGNAGMGGLYIYDSENHFVPFKEILDILKDCNSPVLVGKPKIVLVSTCRGSMIIVIVIF